MALNCGSIYNLAARQRVISVLTYALRPSFCPTALVSADVFIHRRLFPWQILAFEELQR